MKQIISIIITVILTFFSISANAQNEENLYAVAVEIAEIGNRTLSCKVRNHKIIVDQPKAFGGDNLGATPPEMLAVAYGSCVVSTIQLLSAMRELNITDISVKVEGTIDFSKVLGVDTTNRAGFGGLNISVSFNSGMTKEEKEKLLQDVFKIGAAIDNVNNETSVNFELVD